MFKIGRNTFCDQKNKNPMKIPEFKRSGIGLIAEFRGILNRFPNQGSNLSNGSSPDANDDLNSPDSANNNTADANDHLLLSRKHRTHNNMMKYVNQYAAAKGFIPVRRVEGFFEPDIYKQYFLNVRHHPLSLELIDTKTTSNKQPRQGYVACSSKSPGRSRDVACCFQAHNLFNLTKGSFMICCKFTSLSHNHTLPTQLLTVVDLPLWRNVRCNSV